MSSEATHRLSVYDVLAWLEANKKSLMVGFVIVVVVAFGVAAYRWKTEQTEMAASDALLKLKASLGESENAPPPEASAYLKVAEQYPGTSAADRALLLAGAAFFAQGKFGEAHAQFSKFLRDAPQSPFAASAAFGVATSLEAQGKLDEALAGYQNLPVRYPGSGVLDSAKLAAARLHESRNQFDLALRAYEELAKPGGVGSVVATASARKQELLAKHPELAKTNAPTAAISTMVTPAPAATNAAPTATNAAPAATNAALTANPSPAATTQAPEAKPAPESNAAPEKP